MIIWQIAQNQINALKILHSLIFMDFGQLLADNGFCEKTPIYSICCGSDKKERNFLKDFCQLLVIFTPVLELNRTI